jgi:hypothetical protein
MSDMPMEIWAGTSSKNFNFWHHAQGGRTKLYHHHDKYRALEAENEQLRNALNFYADEDSYKDAHLLSLPVGSAFTKEKKPILFDIGQRARKALEKK